MAPKRSTQLIIIGASVFIIGAGLVFLGLRSNKTPASSPAPAAAAPATNTNTQTAGRVVAQGTAAPVPLTLPKGETAVAVHLDAVAGLAGHVTPGDLVNLYATVKSGDKSKNLEPPYSKLFLSNVRVLDVTGVAPDGTGDPTLLLALNPAQAEQAIFFAKFESLWAALVPPSQPAATTAGTDYANDLAKR
jgi:Flp pilus assembly protein CpaB